MRGMQRRTIQRLDASCLTCDDACRRIIRGGACPRHAIWDTHIVENNVANSSGRLVKVACRRVVGARVFYLGLDHGRGNLVRAIRQDWGMRGIVATVEHAPVQTLETVEDAVGDVGRRSERSSRLSSN